MQIYEEEIYRITETVWHSILDLELARRKETLPEPSVVRFLTGYVQITGAWHGAFRLDCSFSLARRLAAIMFHFGARETTMDDIRDALGELTNIAGGNVKGLLPGPCHLSLPVVVDDFRDALHLPGSRILTQMSLECGKEPFRMMLLSLPKEPMLINRNFSSLEGKR